MTTLSPELDLDAADMELVRSNSTSSGSASSSSAASPNATRAQHTTRVTSNDHIALQFYWQGFEVYVHSRASESVAPCFYKSQCGCTPETGGDAEFMRIIPVDEVRERSILDEMKVQVVSLSTGRYLRATRVSKFLRWSETRDEQTVFQIQILDRTKPLTRDAKFTLASCSWPGHYIGFTQTCPLTAGREASKAVGFLTMEKKKSQAPLIFPLRFRAVHRAIRFLRLAASPSFEEPVPFVTTTDLLFIDEEHEDVVAEIPVAIMLPSDNAIQPEHEIRELCPYCSVLFRRRDALLAHIRDYHGDWLHRESVAGSFCTQCGQRRYGDQCRRCHFGGTQHP